MNTNEQPPQPGLVTIGLLIPGECIARVIGKTGAGLKQIRESTGCKLQVSESTGDNTIPRRVSITGFPQAIGMAVQQALMKSFADESYQATVIVFIPLDLARVVIGKAGANLRRVRELLAVRMELERDTVNDPMFGPERKVTLSGSWPSMGQAIAMSLGGAAPLLPFSSPSGMTPMLGIPTPQQTYGYASPHAASSSGSCIANLDVRQVGDDPEEIQLHMSVPDRLVGALLGKEGSQIKQVGAMSGCKVCMSKKDLGERRLVIIGKYSQCVAAQEVLQIQLLAAAEQAGVDVSTNTITFFIRSSDAGAIIGKGGATLKTIREETGAKIQVGRGEVQGQRPCTIEGADGQVMKAVGMIHDLLKEEVEGATEVVESASADEACLLQFNPQGYSVPAPATGKAGAANGKRPKGEGEGGTTKLLVPAKSAGAVIGKQGSGLAQIRELCGVKVEMMQQVQAPQWPEHRVVALQGPFQNRESAAAAVLQAAFQADPTSAQLKMLVPNSEAGAVVGKQGAMLKMIRERCGISVHVEKNDILGDRLVRAQGSLPSVVLVARWIIWSIEGSDDTPAPVAEAGAPQQAGNYEMRGGAWQHVQQAM